MQAKYWLSVVSCLAVTAVVGCGDDASNTLPGTAGSSSGGSGGKSAAGSSSGGSSSGGAQSGGGTTSTSGSGSDGGSNGGTMDRGGAGSGGGGTGNEGGDGGTEAAGGNGGTASGAGGGGAGGTAGGGAGGTAGGGDGGTAGGGAGGTAGGGAGGTAGGGAGGGGNEENPSSLCARDLWKYTFQFCPHQYGGAVDNQPTLAVDGNPATFASSGQAQDGTLYALFDLHGSVDVETLTLDYTGSTNDNDAATMVKVQGSNDGLAFTDITGALSGALTNRKLIIPLTGDTHYRFIKLLQQGTSGSWWAVPELDITCGGGTQAAVPADVGVATDRSQWKVSTPNSPCTTNGVVGNMVDESATSEWQSVGKPGVGYWIHVDMGAKAALTGLHLAHRGTDFPPKLKVQVSNDDVHFTDAATNVTGLADLPIPFGQMQNVRFFRIVSEQDTATQWWTVTDLDIDI